MDTIIKSLNILLVDDHQIIIDGIKLLLNKNPGIEHIYEALNGKAALEIIKEHKIDIVITDVSMPEMTGIELTRIIKVKYPHIKIIVLTVNGSISIIKEIFDLEAEGYLFKNNGMQELEKAINEIAEGGIYYSKEIHRIIKEAN